MPPKKGISSAAKASEAPEAETTATVTTEPVYLFETQEDNRFLSNMFIASFEECGKKFNHNEQLFQTATAEFCATTQRLT